MLGVLRFGVLRLGGGFATKGGATSLSSTAVCARARSTLIMQSDGLWRVVGSQAGNTPLQMDAV